MNHSITTTNLSKNYKDIVCVKDLDLKVTQGTVYGFLGPNGAGKSTTLKMILGLTKPTGGNICIFDKQMNEKNRLKILKEVGSLIESPSYYGHLTGRENLKIMQTLRDVPNKNVEEVLRIVRLKDQAHKKVSAYSLGMKQRLGIACALLGFPKLLVLDEPTNGLDPSGISEMRELIALLPQEYGMTVIVSSHLLSEIDQMAMSIGVIRKGELVFQGSLASLHEKSKEGVAIRTLDNDLAKHILTKEHIPFDTQGQFLVIPSIEDALVAKCTHLLCHNGIELVRIEERKKSLEDIFLELTGTEASL